MEVEVTTTYTTILDPKSVILKTHIKDIQKNFSKNFSKDGSTLKETEI